MCIKRRIEEAANEAVAVVLLDRMMHLHRFQCRTTAVRASVRVKEKAKIKEPTKR